MLLSAITRLSSILPASSPLRSDVISCASAWPALSLSASSVSLDSRRRRVLGLHASVSPASALRSSGPALSSIVADTDDLQSSAFNFDMRWIDSVALRVEVPTSAGPICGVRLEIPSTPEQLNVSISLEPVDGGPVIPLYSLREAADAPEVITVDVDLSARRRAAAILILLSGESARAGGVGRRFIGVRRVEVFEVEPLTTQLHAASHPVPLAHCVRAVAVATQELSALCAAAAATGSLSLVFDIARGAFEAPRRSLTPAEKRAGGALVRAMEAAARAAAAGSGPTPRPRSSLPPQSSILCEQAVWMTPPGHRAHALDTTGERGALVSCNSDGDTYAIVAPFGNSSTPRGFSRGLVSWEFTVVEERRRGDQCTTLGIATLPLAVNVSYSSSNSVAVIRAFNGHRYEWGRENSASLMGSSLVYVEGDVLRFTADWDAANGAGSVSVALNGEDRGVAFTPIAGKEIFPVAAFYGSGRKVRIGKVHASEEALCAAGIQIASKSSAEGENRVSSVSLADWPLCDASASVGSSQVATPGANFPFIVSAAVKYASVQIPSSNKLKRLPSVISKFAYPALAGPARGALATPKSLIAMEVSREAASCLGEYDAFTAKHAINRLRARFVDDEDGDDHDGGDDVAIQVDAITAAIHRESLHLFDSSGASWAVWLLFGRAGRLSGFAALAADSPPGLFQVFADTELVWEATVSSGSNRAAAAYDINLAGACVLRISLKCIPGFPYNDARPRGAWINAVIAAPKSETCRGCASSRPPRALACLVCGERVQAPLVNASTELLTNSETADGDTLSLAASLCHGAAHVSRVTARAMLSSCYDELTAHPTADFSVLLDTSNLDTDCVLTAAASTAEAAVKSGLLATDSGDSLAASAVSAICAAATDACEVRSEAANASSAATAAIARLSAAALDLASRGRSASDCDALTAAAENVMESAAPRGIVASASLAFKAAHAAAREGSAPFAGVIELSTLMPASMADDPATTGPPLSSVTDPRPSFLLAAQVEAHARGLRVRLFHSALPAPRATLVVELPDAAAASDFQGALIRAAARARLPSTMLCATAPRRLLRDRRRPRAAEREDRIAVYLYVGYAPPAAYDAVVAAAAENQYQCH